MHKSTNAKKIVVSLLLVLLVCSVVGSHAEQLSSVFRKTIPIYDLDMGVTRNESRWIMTGNVMYSINYKQPFTINGKKYKVPKSADYDGMPYTKGDLLISTSGHSSISFNGGDFRPSEYKLIVSCSSYSVYYTCRTRGSCHLGKYEYAGSESGSQTSTSKSKTHNKILIK